MGYHASTRTLAAASKTNKFGFLKIKTEAEAIAPADFPSVYREFGGYANPDALSLSAVGIASLSGSSSGVASADDSDGAFVTRSTTASAGNAGSITSSSTVQTRWGGEVICRFKTSSSVANIRLFAGLASADPLTASAPDLNGILLRYDTGVDGTAFFRFYTEFSGNGGSPETTATTLAVAADTLYTVRFVFTATSASVYTWDAVNEEWDLLATHSSIVPASSTAMAFRLAVTPTAAEIKGFKFGYVKGVLGPEPFETPEAVGREHAVYSLAAGVTTAAVGADNNSISSSGSANADDNDGAFALRTTAASNGSTAVVQSGSLDIVRLEWEGEAVVRFKTSSSIASFRIQVGLANANPIGSADPGGDAAFLQYDSATHGTAFWRFYTDFSGNAGSPNVTTTAHPIAADTLYAFKFAFAPGTISAYVWDSVNEEWDLLATHATTIPADTSPMGLHCSVRTGEAVIKGVKFGWAKWRLAK
jgi:hypothetical protein